MYVWSFKSHSDILYSISSGHMFAAYFSRYSHFRAYRFQDAWQLCRHCNILISRHTPTTERLCIEDTEQTVSWRMAANNGLYYFFQDASPLQIGSIAIFQNTIVGMEKFCIHIYICLYKNYHIVRIFIVPMSSSDVLHFIFKRSVIYFNYDS